MTMTRIQDLVPGDIVESHFSVATFITQTAHPPYSGLQLVVWRVHEHHLETREAPFWSLDALSSLQAVGHVPELSDNQREHNLREALYAK
jgi:hypothetical protein